MSKLRVTTEKMRIPLLVIIMLIICFILAVLPVSAKQKKVEAEQSTPGISGQVDLEAELPRKFVTMSGRVNGMHIIETSGEIWCDAWFNIEHTADPSKPTHGIISTTNQKMQLLVSLAWQNQKLLLVTGYEIPFPPEREWLLGDVPYFVITELTLSGTP